MSTLYVGLDLATSSVAVCFLLEDGTQPTKRFTINNNPEGVNVLVTKIKAITSKLDLTELAIGMETTGLLWWHITEALRDHEDLHSLCPKVYPINAKLIAQFKKAYPEASKTDPTCAFVIADRLRFGRLPKPANSDHNYLALQKLTRHRYHLAHSLASEKNRFLTHLFLTFSGFSQEKPLSDAFGATASSVLTEFLSVDEIANMDIEALVEFIQEKSRSAFPDPGEVAAAIKQAAQNSYRLSKPLAEPMNLILSMILRNIRFFEKQIDEIDKAIADQLAPLSGPKVLLSVKGLGPVFTAGLIAEIQEVHRFDSDDSLARFASIVWKKNQSGEFDGDETPMMRSGNKYLRYYFIEAANSLRMHNEEFKAYYQTKYSESTKHHHKRACVLTARKAVRLVYTLLRKEQLYQTPEQRKEARAADPPPSGLTSGELARHISRRRQAAKRAKVH